MGRDGRRRHERIGRDECDRGGRRRQPHVHRLRSRRRGHTAISAAVTVTVANDPTPPSVAITRRPLAQRSQARSRQRPTRATTSALPASSSASTAPRSAPEVTTRRTRWPGPRRRRPTAVIHSRRSPATRRAIRPPAPLSPSWSATTHAADHFRLFAASAINRVQRDDQLDDGRSERRAGRLRADERVRRYERAGCDARHRTHSESERLPAVRSITCASGSRDAAGNLALSGDSTFATLDGTPRRSRSRRPLLVRLCCLSRGNVAGVFHRIYIPIGEGDNPDP